MAYLVVNPAPNDYAAESSCFHFRAERACGDARATLIPQPLYGFGRRHCLKLWCQTAHTRLRSEANALCPEPPRVVERSAVERLRSDLETLVGSLRPIL